MAHRITADDAPKCFLHIPKSGGTSIREALEAAFPPGTVAPCRIDDALVGAPDDIGKMSVEDRARLATGDDEVEALARYRIVSGHFSLRNLLRVAPATNVITVLREPRARLLSTFLYLRLSQFAELRGEHGQELLEGPSESLEAMLTALRMAPLVDNVVCRLLLRGDAGLRKDRFIAEDDVQDLADAALERLDRLGDVVLWELDDVWSRLSNFFGTSLTPRRSNVAGENRIPDDALPIPRPEMLDVLNMMDQRSAADRLVYEELLARRRDDPFEARRMTDAVFAEALVRFGDLTGVAATKLHGSSQVNGNGGRTDRGRTASSQPSFARPPGLGALGPNSYIAEPYKIRAPHRVHIGDNVVVGERLFLSLVQTDHGIEFEPELRIGDDTRIASDLFLHCTGLVQIGNGVRIGPRVFIGDSGRDYEDPAMRPGSFEFAPPQAVRIADSAVVGAGAIILEGISIGAGARVAPGSVVTRDVRPGSVVSGNPARIRSGGGDRGATR